jgi:hypothetical protein
MQETGEPGEEADVNLNCNSTDGRLVTISPELNISGSDLPSLPLFSAVSAFYGVDDASANARS